MLGRNENREACPAEIALDRHLPPRVADLHVIAKHAGIGLRVMLADGRKGAFDVGRINRLFTLEPQNLLILLLALPRKVLITIAPTLMERGDSIAAAFGLSRASVPIFVQLELRPLRCACGVELPLELVEVAREIFLKELVDRELSR